MAMMDYGSENRGGFSGPTQQQRSVATPQPIGGALGAAAGMLKQGGPTQPPGQGMSQIMPAGPGMAGAMFGGSAGGLQAPPSMQNAMQGAYGMLKAAPAAQGAMQQNPMQGAMQNAYAMAQPRVNPMIPFGSMQGVQPSAPPPGGLGVSMPRSGLPQQGYLSQLLAMLQGGAPGGRF